MPEREKFDGNRGKYAFAGEREGLPVIDEAPGRPEISLGVGPGKAVRQRLWAHSKTNTGRVLKIRRWTKYRHDWGIKSLTCSSELRYSFAGFNEVSASSQRCILIDDSTELRRAGLMHGSAPFIHA